MKVTRIRKINKIRKITNKMAIKTKCGLCGKEKVIYNYKKNKNFVCCNAKQDIASHLVIASNSINQPLQTKNSDGEAEIKANPKSASVELPMAKTEPLFLEVEEKEIPQQIEPPKQEPFKYQCPKGCLFNEIKEEFDGSRKRRYCPVCQIEFN